MLRLAESSLNLNKPQTKILVNFTAIVEIKRKHFKCQQKETANLKKITLLFSSMRRVQGKNMILNLILVSESVTIYIETEKKIFMSNLFKVKIWPYEKVRQ